MILQTVDAQLRESRGYDRTKFPVAYYRNELAHLPNRTGPLHWHPDFELLTAETGTLDYQVGRQHIKLEAGDSIFVNENVLHSVRQIGGEKIDPMPNIVFSGTLLAPETSAIYKKYIDPLVQCDELPFIIFRRGETDIEPLVLDIYRCFEMHGPCWEVQHDTTMPLQEIGEACGFNSANYFSRQFKKAYGYTPGQK